MIGLLPGAIKRHHNIVCEGEVSKELLFNICNIYIPSVIKYDSTLSPIKIEANTQIEDEFTSNTKKTGTGLTMGIDSLYVLKKYRHDARYGLDCCLIFDVGDFDVYRNHDKTEYFLLKKAQSLAKTIELPLVFIKSNIGSIFPGQRGTRLTYYHIACIIAAKSFLYRYYSATSYTVQDLSLINNSWAGEYDELFLASIFSTSNIKIIPLPIELSRIEKTNEISNYDIAQKYLHVCMREPYNCGICKKCRRTLITLDLLGKLDNFSNVFNIEYYKTNRKDYFEWMQLNAQNDDYFCKDILQMAKKKKSNLLSDQKRIQIALTSLFDQRQKIGNKAEFEQKKKRWNYISSSVLALFSNLIIEKHIHNALVVGKNYRTTEIINALNQQKTKIHSVVDTTTSLLFEMDNIDKNNIQIDSIIVCNTTDYSMGLIKEILNAYDIPTIYIEELSKQCATYTGDSKK